MDDREVQALIAACYYNDIDCMVRPQTLERLHLYHYLEDGAAGVMIPFVSTPAIAQQVVEAVKYPPLGNRGLDADYGLDAWRPDTTYLDDANRETFIVAQIETPEGVENIEAIAAVPGIDCVFIGPGDLGLRLRVGNSPLVIPDVAERVAAAARANGIAWGIAVGSIEELIRYRDMDAQMVPWGSGFVLRSVFERCSKELDAVLTDDDRVIAH